MERLARRRGGWFVGWSLAFSAAALTPACTSDPPTVFVGESTHFRLYVDPDLLPLPAALSGDNALAALETEWGDVETLLKMPDGKITYRWYTSAHILDTCGKDAGGCTKQDDMEVDAPTLPHEHELNHAYAYLRAQRSPIPLLAEGLAEAIACDGELQATGGDADWRAMVASLDHAEAQTQGGLFVRALIRTYGIDAFLRYYEQSPERRDPALFGANFESFWGASLDDVWAQAHGGYRGAVIDTKVCPCSLPPLVPTDPLVNDVARAPYWTLPIDLSGQTLALTADPLGGTALIDCSGSRRGPPGASSVLARLDTGAGWFVRAPLRAASLGRFVSDDCAGADHYPLPADPYGRSYLTVAVPTSVASSGVVVGIDVSAAAQVDYSAREICASCSFDQGSCQPAAAADRTPVSGTFYMRLAADSFAAFPGDDLAWSDLRFLW